MRDQENGATLRKPWYGLRRMEPVGVDAGGMKLTAQARWWSWICGLTTFLYGALAATPWSGFLDADEFVAQATTLGISHPPGQPLYALFGRMCLMVFWGPPVFRLAMGNALANGCAAVLGFRIAWWVQRSLSTDPEVKLSLFAAWLVHLGVAATMQATRPEVYALTHVLVLSAWHEALLRRFVRGFFLIGLALSTHYVIAGLALLPMLWFGAYCNRGKLWSWTLGVLPGLALGLLPWMILPLRAGRAGFALGEPNTWSNFFWVVSGKAFQHSHSLQPSPLGERLLEVVSVLHDQFHITGTLIAFAGLYMLWRLPGQRVAAGFWTLAVFPPLIIRAGLGFVRGNPDALGYLLPSLSALALLVVAGASLALQLAKGALGGTRWLKGALWILPLWSWVVAGAHWPQVDLHARVAGGDLVYYRYDQLPDNSVVLAHLPATMFQHWGRSFGQSYDGTRLRHPLLIPVPLLSYPGLAERLIGEAPELRGVVVSALLERSASRVALEELAALRPTFIEWDLHVSRELYATLAPSGFLYRVFDGEATLDDVRAGFQERNQLWAVLMSDARQDLAHESESGETRKQLEWIAFSEVVLLMERGLVPEARVALNRARGFAPSDFVLLRLDEVLTSIENDPRARNRLVPINTSRLVAM